MLESLHLHDVGPSSDLRIDFARRMNFLTGDNGLGKSFLLDIAWWALTRTWAHMPAAPHRRPSRASRFASTARQGAWSIRAPSIARHSHGEASRDVPRTPAW